MRRLNLKPLLILIAAAVVLGGGAFALNRWQLDHSAERLGKLAAKALAEAEAAKPADQGPLYRKSSELYSRYLTYRPNDIDALANYARILTDSGNAGRAAEALALYGRVQGSPKYVNDPEVLRRMVRLSLGQKRYLEAERLVDGLLSESNPHYEMWSRDAEIYRIRGYCRAERADTEMAIADYRKAAELEPLDPVAPAQLAHLLRTNGHGEEADQVLDRMVRAQEEAKPPTDPDKLPAFNRARAFAYLQRADDRINSASRIQHGRTPEAIAGPALADALRAAELDPSFVEPLIAVAKITELRERPDWNQLRHLLQPAIDKFPEDSRIYLMLAESYQQTGRLEEAIAVLERGRHVLDNEDIAYLLAHSYIEQGNIDAPPETEAKDRRNPPQRIIDDLRRRSYDKGRLALLEARLIMADRDRDSKPIGDDRWRQAARKIRDEVLAMLRPNDSATDQARRMLIACIDADPTLPSEEKVSQKNQALQQVALDGSQKATETILQMAATLEALGRYSEAVQAYASIQVPTAEVLLSKGLAELRAAFEVPAADRDWGPLETTLARLDKLAPDHPRLPLLRAEMLVARNDLDAAQVALDTARRAHPEQIEAWNASVMLAERRNQPEAVERLITEAEAQAVSADRPLTDKIGAMLLRVRQLGSKSGPESVARLDDLANQVASIAAPDDRQRLLRGLTSAYVACGEPKRALDLWLKFLDQSNSLDSLMGQIVAFDLALSAGDRAAQDRAIARLKSPSVEGENGVYWRMAQARQDIAQVEAMPLADRQGPTARTLLDGARDLLNEVARQRANNPRVAVALGTIADLEGRSEEATSQFYTAFRLGERDLNVLRRTITLLTESRRYAQARTVLESVLRRSSSTPDLERFASQIAYHERDYNRALSQAQSAVDGGSKDPLDYTWLAQLMLATNRRAEAEAMLRRAIAIAPDRPEGYLLLIEHLAQFGRAAEVNEMLAAAEKNLTSSNPLGLAQCLEIAGRPREADVLYRRILGNPPEGPIEPGRLAAADASLLRNYATFLSRRGRRNDASRVYEAIIAQASASGRPDDLQWARSLLSLLKSRDTDDRVAGQAIADLGLPADPGTDLSAMATTAPPGELRVKYRVLAVQRDPARRRQAIQILEKLRDRRAADPTDLLVLAGLYETSEDWERAQTTYRDAIAANPLDARPHVAYIQALLRRKVAADQILPWIDRLEKTHGQSPRSIQLRALVLKGEKKDDQAIAVVTDFASKDPRQTAGAARLLELMGYTEAAERLFRANVEKGGPAATLALAEFLGRRDRVVEALDLCEPLWKSTDPVLVANACCTILLDKDQPEQARRVERWLIQAAARQPENAQLQALRGVLLFVMGRPGEAESVYRTLLEKNPSDPLVLNNLAWLLAFQEGKGNEALELVNRAIDSIGTNAPALLDTRAVIQIARHEPELAIRDIETALAGANNPEPNMYFHLAQARLMAGQNEAARRAWDDGQLLGLKREAVDQAERAAYDEMQARLATPPKSDTDGKS
jgi:tetratricopeptide (TPR) repeat protein